MEGYSIIAYTTAVSLLIFALLHCVDGVPNNSGEEASQSQAHEKASSSRILTISITVVTCGLVLLITALCAAVTIMSRMKGENERQGGRRILFGYEDYIRWPPEDHEKFRASARTSTASRTIILDEEDPTSETSFTASTFSPKEDPFEIKFERMINGGGQQGYATVH